MNITLRLKTRLVQAGLGYGRLVKEHYDGSGGPLAKLMRKIS